jgi:L-arabinose isomerase
VQLARVPTLVLNLQPCDALDYENTDTGEWLANCSACCVPEISNAFERAGIDFRVVSGTLRGQHAPWNEIGEWVKAAAAVRGLNQARVGFIGHTYPGMLDLYSDFTMVSAQTGAHIEVLEMCDLDKRVSQVTPGEISAKLDHTRAVFEIVDCADESLEWAAAVACGLDRLVADFGLNGLTYYYRGLDGNEYERLGASLILGNSLLTARGVAASGEGDLKTCLAMMLMNGLGAGGSFTEFYAMDFSEGFVLMGHDGPMHLSIAEGSPVLRGLGLFHGKRGHGVSVECKVRTGDVTLLAITQTRQGSLKMITAEGASLPGPVLKIGNTNSRIRFNLGPAEFVNRWCREAPTHHCALGVGQQAGAIEKAASLLKLPLARV